MTAKYFMVLTIFCSPCALGQYYYPPEYFHTIPQSHYANPNIFYQPLTTSYQYSVPENTLEISQNNPEPLIEANLKYSEPLQEQTFERFRGFGYHNRFSDDARSTVFFFSGSPLSNLENVSKEKIAVACNGCGSQLLNSVDPQALDSFENIIQQIFEKKSTGKSGKSLNFEKPKLAEDASFSPLTPMVKTFLESPLPSGQVYYFYSVPEVNENSIESRALFENNNETNEAVEETINNINLTITTERHDKEILKTKMSENQKAKFVIEYKSSPTERLSANSTTVRTSTTTTEMTESTTDYTTTDVTDQS